MMETSLILQFCLPHSSPLYVANVQKEDSSQAEWFSWESHFSAHDLLFLYKNLVGIWQNISHNPDKSIIISYLLAGVFKSVQ